MSDKIKIIFFGDIMGKIGRKAIAHIIPEWKQKYQPDILMANVENIAHGKGVTKKSLDELKGFGIDIMTSGNHVWKKEDANILAQSKKYNLLTPENDPRTPAKQGFGLFNINGHKIFTINLIAQEGMAPKISDEEAAENNIISPFAKADEILSRPEVAEADAIVVDFHSEFTSETRALGWYLDGKVSAMFSTHTHVPTADAQILPQGTGYITDVGMVGAYHSVLGIEKDIIVKRFIDNEKIVFTAPEKGTAEINAIYLEIDKNTKKTIKIELLRQMVEII